MTNADYFSDANPFAGHKPHSVEWWINNFDPDAGRNGLEAREFENWEKARDIIAERQRVAAERETHKRAASFKAAQERIQYSDQLAQTICQRISGGELLTCICANDPRMPTCATVTRWLKEHRDFSALYNEALQDRLVVFEEDIVALADSIPREPQRATARNSKEKISFIDHVQHAKIRIEVRMRWLKALKPQRWSDQQTLNLRQDDPFNDVANMSDEEISRVLQELDEKESAGNQRRPTFKARQPPDQVRGQK